MNTIKYLVYSGDGSDNLLAWFDEEVEAIAFAKENVGEQTRVEKAECDLAEDGFLNEIINSKTIWSYLDNNVNEFDQEFPEEEPNEFDTDFPESDINDLSEPDDEDFGDYAWEDDNKLMQGFSMREAVDALEENESEVECKCCFELFPKEDCIKTEKGYLCKKCNQELHSHQGTNLDLIDSDPFSLDYEDPRDPEEEEEPEIKEEPVDANEVRKHEAGIEENLNEDVMSLADQVGNRCLDFWESQRDIGKWNPQAMAEYDITDPEEYADYVIKNIWTVDDIYASIKDKVQGEESEVKKLIDAWIHDSLEFEVESLKEHINDRPADIESDQEYQGVDNAVVDCKKYTLVAHSEDEKPVDCKLEKPALEEPLAGEEVDGKFYEDLSDEEKKALDEEIENLDLEEAKEKVDLDAILKSLEKDEAKDPKVIAELLDELHKIEKEEGWKITDQKLIDKIIEDAYVFYMNLVHNANGFKDAEGALATAFADHGSEIEADLKANGYISESLKENDELDRFIKPSTKPISVDEFSPADREAYIKCGQNGDKEGQRKIAAKYQHLNEAKKDDELPVDPEAAKLQVHTMLNDLVADEIEAINGYEEAKAEIMDTPIAHKDNILDTIDHVEDEEKEHVDELISATTEIPFDKEEAPAPVVEEPVVEEEPAVEEEPLNQDFPEVEENLEERVDLPAFDSDVKVGDSILIVNMEGEPDYCGRKGKVDHIDSLGQLHGTWGGLAVIPGVDKFDIITNECLKEDTKAPKYKVVVSWEGTFCGEKRVYKNDRFHTYEFDHEPTKQEVEDKFYNDPNIIRLKNWSINNVRKEVKDFMDEVGAYGNEEGWKDIKLTGYKVIKENLNENWIIQPEIGEKLRIASDQAALNDFKKWAGKDQQAVSKFEKYLGKVGTVTYVDGNIVNLKFDDMNENERLTLPRWFLHQFISSVDGWAIVHENLNEEKEAGDKVKSYNDGLKLAKVYNKPVIYGYENKSYGGKFFALDDPIVCTSVVDETKKFKQQYKSCGVVYVAYPDKDFAESLKESMKLSEYWWEDNDPMNQVDQEEDNVECGWCGETYPKSECRHEQDFGYLCPQCQAELKSRGEKLTFIENEDLEQKHDEEKWAITIDGEQKFVGSESEMKDKIAELEKTDAAVAHKIELVKGADVLVNKE